MKHNLVINVLLYYVNDVYRKKVNLWYIQFLCETPVASNRFELDFLLQTIDKKKMCIKENTSFSFHNYAPNCQRYFYACESVQKLLHQNDRMIIFEFSSYINNINGLNREPV